MFFSLQVMSMKQWLVPINHCMDFNMKHHETSVQQVKIINYKLLSGFLQAVQMGHPLHLDTETGRGKKTLNREKGGKLRKNHRGGCIFPITDRCAIDVTCTQQPDKHKALTMMLIPVKYMSMSH